MANTSIFAAFERMWQHITSALNNKSDIDHNHTDLQEQLEEKSQVQIITSTETESSIENLSILQIHKLSKEQYQQMLESGVADENSLYLTPDEELDLTPYATVEYVDEVMSSMVAITNNAVAQKSQVQIITWEEND